MRICPSCLKKGDLKICPNDGFPTVELKDIEISSKDPLIGKTFNEKYKILKLLGAGGMGSVYEALNIVMDQHVAIKILKKEIAGNLQVIKRFIKEARVVSKLSHHNTIKVFDFGHSQEGYLFIAMEFLKGKPLSQVISEDGRIEPFRVITIILQILKSLGEAHKHSIIHRDLKPQNIFLCEVYGEKDFVKVLDFGIAKSAEESSTTMNLTSEGQVIGTPHYLSPEQASGHTLDHRSDLYSIGVIIYEMLTGNVPFTDTSIPAILMKHLTEPPKPLNEIIPDVKIPEELESLLLKLLQKSPDLRPANVEQLIEILEKIKTGDSKLEIDLKPSMQSEDMDESLSQTEKMTAPFLGLDEKTTGYLSTNQDSLLKFHQAAISSTPETIFEKPKGSAFFNWLSKRPSYIKIGLGLLSVIIISGLAIAGYIMFSDEEIQDNIDLSGKQKNDYLIESIKDVSVAAAVIEDTIVNIDSSRHALNILPSAAENNELPIENKEPLNIQPGNIKISKPKKLLSKINLNINTFPSNAEIFIDGKKVGVSPVDFTLPYRSNKMAVLKVIKDEYEIHEQEIPLFKDSKLTININKKQIHRKTVLKSVIEKKDLHDDVIKKTIRQKKKKDMKLDLF